MTKSLVEYLSTPALSWDAIHCMEKVAYMYLFFEEGMSGRVIFKRHS